MRALYAPEIADRILHDRQLCSFIADTIMDIGFDGWPLFTEKVLFIGLNLNNVKEAVASPE